MTSAGPSRIGWSRSTRRAGSGAALLLAIAACGDRSENHRFVGELSSCTGSDTACVLGAALDALSAKRGNPSLLFADTIVSRAPGVDPRSMQFSVELLSQELSWLQQGLPALREDTKRSFASANTPPVQTTIAPTTRSRFLFLRDSASRALYYQRSRGEGLEAGLADAAKVSYLQPGFSANGEQALVFVEWTQASLSGTSQFFLLERVSPGQWRVVDSFEAGWI